MNDISQLENETMKKMQLATLAHWQHSTVFDGDLAPISVRDMLFFRCGIDSTMPV